MKLPNIKLNSLAFICRAAVHNIWFISVVTGALVSSIIIGEETFGRPYASYPLDYGLELAMIFWIIEVVLFLAFEMGDQY